MAKKKKKIKKLNFLTFLLIIMGTFMIMVSATYIYLSAPVDKNSSAIIEVEVKSGSSISAISKMLKERGLIRNQLVFILSAKFHSEKTLKATVYELSKSMSTDEIIEILTEGNTYNPNSVRITFQEGKTVKNYAEQISKKTNHSYEEIMAKLSDDTYLDYLIKKYWFLTNEIKNQDIYVPLEGYLSPNTYDFNSKDESLERIIEVMLDQTGSELSKYENQIEKSGMSVHEYLTLSSMLELEGTSEKSRRMIAGVFYNRLKIGMSLGSDVTTYYAFQEEMTKDLTTAQFNTSNPYNTRSSDMAGKLPVGPICNPSISSIESSLNPTDHNYLYFVADKHGKIYYTKTEKEHLAKVTEIKEKGDWIW